jgi:hypothetical protein
VDYHLPTVSPSAFLVFVYWKFTWRSALCHSSLLRYAQNTSPPLLCVPFQSLVSSSFFFFFFLQGEGQSVQGTMLVYPRGDCGSTMCHLFAHLFVCVS